MPDRTPESETTVVRRTAKAPAPRTRRARPRAAPVVVLLAVAGLVAASNLTVTQNRDTQALYAERFEITEALVVEASSVWPSKVARAADGAEGDPAELAAGLPEARTALAQDEWVYTVTVKERAADSVEAGTYTAELFLDEVSTGRIFVEQATRDAASVEGVRASFALGPALAVSALYHIVVKPWVQAGPVVEFTVKSTPSGDLTWTGEGGDIEGAVNPSLSLALGSTLRLTARDADGILHNIGLKDASGTLVNPPGWSPDIEAVGDTRSLTWTPAAEGTYTYLCKYHAATMKGALTVTA